MDGILFDIGAIIIVATFFGYIAKLLKQPLIPAYILAGVLLGPVLGLITDSSIITTLSEIGIAFLLFLVGMEMDLARLKEVGVVSSVGGLIQFGLLFSAGFVISDFFNLSPLLSVYMGFVLALSSTMVIVKLLSDKKELDTLHGRVVVGMLLIQDVIAVLALTIMNNLSLSSWSTIGLSLAKGVGVLVLLFFLGRLLFPKIFEFAARSQELLFLLAVSICLLFALLLVKVGFSIIIGAFFAGLLLGNLPYNLEIKGRVEPLKDFFTVLFFGAIGLEVMLTELSYTWLLFSAFFFATLILIPFVTMVVISFFGYKSKTSFISGISLAQVSEFSLILVVQGNSLGHVPDRIFSLVILLAIASITVTSYFIKFDSEIYSLLSKFLSGFDRLSKVHHPAEGTVSSDVSHEIVLFGADRTGFSILEKLRELGRDFVVVDFNPEIIKHLGEKGIPCVYGDVSDVEVLERLNLDQVEMVISTVPTFEENKFLIHKVKEENEDASIILTSHKTDDALELYEEGADYVIIPYFLGGDHISLILEEVTGGFDALVDRKLSHIKELHERKRTHPKHNGG